MVPQEMYIYSIIAIQLIEKFYQELTLLLYPLLCICPLILITEALHLAGDIEDLKCIIQLTQQHLCLLGQAFMTLFVTKAMPFHNINRECNNCKETEMLQKLFRLFALSGSFYMMTATKTHIHTLWTKAILRNQVSIGLWPAHAGYKMISEVARCNLSET